MAIFDFLKRKELAEIAGLSHVLEKYKPIIDVNKKIICLNCARLTSHYQTLPYNDVAFR